MPTCNGVTAKYAKCGKQGKFLIGSHLFCGTHKNKLENNYCKNTLKSRKTSLRYMIAMSLFSSHLPSSGNYEIHDAGNCFYCGCKFGLGTAHAIDHILPIIFEGKPNNKNVISHTNLVDCCVSCNSSKGNREIITWMKSHKNNNINNPVKIQEMCARINNIPDIPSDMYTQMLYKFSMANNEIERIIESLEPQENHRQCSFKTRCCSIKNTILTDHGFLDIIPVQTKEYVLKSPITGKVLSAHENCKHVYWSSEEPWNWEYFTIDEHKRIISSHDTYIWYDEESEQMWQYHKDNDNMEGSLFISGDPSPHK
jgi:5-methylcytosine-specific restriction endonuclease McrA